MLFFFFLYLIDCNQLSKARRNKAVIVIMKMNVEKEEEDD